MGKVLSSFTNGFVGAASRSIDNVIISMKNGAGGEIPFGAPVFMVAGENTCDTFDENSADTAFLGFAVRVPDKTPEVYGSSEAAFQVGDPVEVLVRGSVVLPFDGSAAPGANVYIRKADGKLVTSAGASGSTLLLPNVKVRTGADSAGRAEVVVLKRNIL